MPGFVPQQQLPCTHEDVIASNQTLRKNSFQNARAGRWKGVAVAIKVVDHMSAAGNAVDAARESVLSSSVQHPNVVSSPHVLMLMQSWPASLHQSMCSLTGPTKPFDDCCEPMWQLLLCHAAAPVFQRL